MGQFVTLTWYEQTMATLCGALRRAETQRKGLTPRGHSDTEEHALTTDIDAGGAEHAVAKLIMGYWAASVNDFDGPDILPDIEVRHTRRKDGHLIIREKDPDYRRFVLVCGTMPTYEIMGWIRARDAKQNPDWLRNPNGEGECYMVPQSALQPIANKWQEWIEKNPHANPCNSR